MSIFNFLYDHAVGPTQYPTTEIYFTSSLKGLIGPLENEEQPIWRISSNAFYIPGDRPKAVVIRSWDAATKIRLSRFPRADLYYILDDDIWAGSEDCSLPPAYRKRLNKLCEGPAREILSVAKKIYVPSRTLASQLDIYEIGLVSPALIQPTSDLMHHVGEREKTRIVLPITRSHLFDLEAIAEDLTSFMKDNPDCQLDMFLKGHSPSILDLENVRNYPAESWKIFRKRLRSSRYHIALLPTQPTQFNASRSHNKILEIAYLGAAPVYSSDIAFRDLVIEDETGIFCENKPGIWYAALDELVQNRMKTREIAAANCQLAQIIGSPLAKREFWKEEFGLEG